MTYICSTANCAIALSNATFPVGMNCPVCQNPLVANNDSIELTNEDIALINSLPYVIAYPLKQTLLEKHAWTKINLLKDTFLNYLKYIALLSASEFFNSEIKDKGMVALFHKNLMETAFGKWNHFIRECLLFLKQQNHLFFYPELLAYYELVETGNKAKKYKGEIEYQDANGDTQYIVQTSVTGIGMLINFRNRYLGHGLTLDADKSEKLWNEYFPIFRYLLEQMSFTKDYPMLKREAGETYELQTSEIKIIDSNTVSNSNIWIQNKEGEIFDILPFFIVPGEVSLKKEDREQLLTYESYTGKTIKFFSPEGTEKQTSGKILDKLNLLLREKLKEVPFIPETFTKEEFLKRIAEENKLLIDTLIAEKKIITGVYQHREEMEIKLREWIGARANIFFIAAEAGSGKTNLLVEIQKQYAERELPSLLIRAGRMEKKLLREQIAYLLNIDLEQGLVNYTSIAGTQAQPTFILIDGLNEANNAEEIWQEILDISKVFEPGGLKFIITNRANTKSDLERYEISENDQAYLYGENKENEKGLVAYSFWLTALDMQEMKGAWDSYAAKDKSKYKPQFSFDEIATFDRGLYNQINNPLILRLFLEIYNGKVLPKKGAKYLNIWHDWLKTFSQEEHHFLKLLADEIWVKGENELLLDDLLKNEILKPYFTTDIINSPYLRLQNKGWISRYVKGLNAYVGITVEGALLYLLGIKLQQQVPAIDIEIIQVVLTGGNKLQKSAIESFLCEQALNGDLDLVTELIDRKSFQVKFLISPIIIYFKFYGAERSIEKILKNESNNDWIILKSIVDEFQKLNMFKLKSDTLKALIRFIKFDSKENIYLGIYASLEVEKGGEESKYLINKLNEVIWIINTDVELLNIYGSSLFRFGEKQKALECSNACIEIRIRQKSFTDLELAKSYLNSSYVYMSLKQYEPAEEYAKKALDILMNYHYDDYINNASAYNMLGMIMAEKYNFEESHFFHKQSLEIKVRNLGEYHISVASSYFNLGFLFFEKSKFEKSLEYHLQSYEIKLKLYGLFNDSMYNSCRSIAITYLELGEENLSIDFYEKCIQIAILLYGQESSELAVNYNDLGLVLKSKGKYDKALEYYEKSLAVRIKTFGVENPRVAISYYNIGLLFASKGEYDKALDYYEKCLAIRIKTLGGEHPYVATTYFRIGDSNRELKKYSNAIVIYKKGFNIEKKGGYPFNIAKCYEALNKTNEALNYFIQSAEIRKDDPDAGMKDESTQDSIANAKRLAKELNVENELPEWIKEM